MKAFQIKKTAVLITACVLSITITKAQTVTRPSAVFQIQKTDPGKLKTLLKKFPLSKNFNTQERDPFVKTGNLNSVTELTNANKEDNSIQTNTSACVNPPLLLSGFEGNALTPFYLPPVGYYASESNIAISNAGRIVSISNGWIRYYNADGTLTFSDSLYHFCSCLIDVHVVYDPKSDRFVFIAEWGITDFASIFQGLGIVAAFSKTNDPINGWNFYYLSESIFNDNSVGDYPLLAISDNEIFITYSRSSKGGNLNHYAILQADKKAGYVGSALNTQIFSVSPATGTIVPAQGGSTTYGPNMYFLEANESAHPSNNYTLFEITNTIASGHAVLKKYDHIYSNISYEAPHTSYQPGGNTLVEVAANISGWIKGAFYENGLLQFCQNTSVNGKAAICLGHISGIPNNISCTAKTISDPDLYFSFPGITYVGNSSADNSAIVGFEHTGTATYPGLSAVYVNSNFDISSRIIVKAGSDTINGLWGDYTGICRRYNHPGECWFEGQYGSTTFPNINWIAKLKSQECSSTLIADLTEVKGTALSKNALFAFPNPFSNSTTISFSLSQSQKVSIQIFDMDGKLIKTITNAEMQAGAHQFTWNAKDEKGNAISAGIYYLKLTAGSYAETKKIIVIK